MHFVHIMMIFIKEGNKLISALKGKVIIRHYGQLSLPLPLPTGLLVPLGIPPWVGMQWGGFLMFTPKMQEGLNIEQFHQRKFKTIKTRF
jgi:hypothetical protein